MNDLVFANCKLIGHDRRGPPLAPRPDRAGILLLGRRHPFEYQLLHSGGGLREIDIAFGVSRDVMARSQNAGRLDRAHDIERLAINAPPAPPSSVMNSRRLIRPLRQLVPTAWAAR